jgi:hypothetical protein
MFADSTRRVNPARSRSGSFPVDKGPSDKSLQYCRVCYVSGDQYLEYTC